jgi:hypothetical protein
MARLAVTASEQITTSFSIEYRGTRRAKEVTVTAAAYSNTSPAPIQTSFRFGGALAQPGSTTW